MNVVKILFLAHLRKFLRVSNDDLLCTPSFVLLLELLLFGSSLTFSLFRICISFLCCLDDADESCALFATLVFHLKRELETGRASLRGGCSLFWLLPRAVTLGAGDLRDGGVGVGGGW